MRKTGILLLSILFYTGVRAQSPVVQQYIDTYKDLAIREMKRTGIPASITIAQGILETESGKSNLVLKSNNHFGIKCKSSWVGGSVYHDDDEEGECFRKYNSAEESFRDHSDFLRNSQRYAFLFSLDIKDYKGWAYGLKKAGYATNPRYPYILMNSIEKYNLHQYTLRGLSGDDVFDEGKYKDEKEKEQTIPIIPVKMDDASLESPVSTIKNHKTLYNGLKAVFSLRETSLLAIATENNIALSKLLEFNDLKTDGLLQEDQWVFLEKKLKQGNMDIYVAKGGGSLYDVAQASAVQLEYLHQYNQMKGDLLLTAGTRVLLRPGVVIMETKEAAAKKKIHEVLPKECLYAISKKYNVSIKEIKEWNSLTSDDLHVGQQLIILK